MAEIYLVKLASGHLAPMGDEAAEALLKIKVGRVVTAKIVQPRNYLYHKKFFALMTVGFNYWSEVAPTADSRAHKGQSIAPNIDRFRKDITILAGYFEESVRLNGEVRLEAKSISFGSMEQEEFEKLFSACLNVLLERVLTDPKFTEASVRRAVDEIMSFDQ